MTDAQDWEEPGPKYIVFKQEDWNRTEMGVRPSDAIDDAVVIRLKDPFAATALYTYANTIMSFLELMEENMTKKEHQRMLDIADYFSTKAMESERIKGKRLPD